MRKLHFQGFCFAAIYWGSPTLGRLLLYQALRKVAFVASSYAATSWEIIGTASVFCSNPLGNSHLWIVFLQQAIGEEQFLGLLLFQTIREKASSASKLVGNSELPSFCAKLFEDFDCELLFCLKLLRGYDSESSYILNTPPSPHLAISVHQVS